MHHRHTPDAHHNMTLLGVGLLVILALLVLMLALPGRAGAAPRRDHGLTIAATPQQITAGQGVLIYGQLFGPNAANQRVWLFHRVDPAARFTPVGVTHTNGAGFYEFVRNPGVVISNRSWFVRSARGAHSRTVHEWVSATVTFAASTATAMTGQPVSFTGTVAPVRRHQLVLLQQQDSVSGNGWQTIASGYTNGASAFTIVHRFRSAGSYTLRALFPRDARNLAGASASLSLAVQQQQRPSFTITGSAPEVADGQSVTIGGTLYAAGSTTVTQSGVAVTLYGRQPSGPFRALASTTTGTTGGYAFTQTPAHNMVYYVATASARRVRTAALYVGVEDVVNAALSANAVAVGQRVELTGTVVPSHGGHAVYLQEQNTAGQWLTVGVGFLGRQSRFALAFTPGQVGTVSLRVQITGGPWNIGGVSAPLQLMVSGVTPAASLPPAP